MSFTTYCNLSNINDALRGGLLDLIEVRLMCVGAGPTLDFADATAFLAAFQPMIDRRCGGGSNERLICQGGGGGPASRS